MPHRACARSGRISPAAACLFAHGMDGHSPDGGLRIGHAATESAAGIGGRHHEAQVK